MVPISIVLHLSRVWKLWYFRVRNQSVIQNGLPQCIIPSRWKIQELSVSIYVKVNVVQFLTEEPFRLCADLRNISVMSNCWLLPFRKLLACRLYNWLFKYFFYNMERYKLHLFAKPWYFYITTFNALNDIKVKIYYSTYINVTNKTSEMPHSRHPSISFTVSSFTTRSKSSNACKIFHPFSQKWSSDRNLASSRWSCWSWSLYGGA